jgi:hypothetical protein
MRWARTMVGEVFARRPGARLAAAGPARPHQMTHICHAA